MSDARHTSRWKPLELPMRLPQPLFTILANQPPSWCVDVAHRPS
jgi:hypothetical protein